MNSNANEPFGATPRYLPPHQFTYDLYGPLMGYSGHKEWDYANKRPAAGFDEIGRCDARNLMLRPRDNGWAVMLYDKESGETFWLHVYDFGD